MAASSEYSNSGDGLAMDSEDASMKHHEQLRKILFGSLPFEFLGHAFSAHLRSSSCDFNAVHLYICSSTCSCWQRHTMQC
jgi:hypothetical protein